MSFFRRPLLFIAWSAMPPVIEPSPTTAMTLYCSCARSRAVAIPKAAEIAVLACPARRNRIRFRMFQKTGRAAELA